MPLIGTVAVLEVPLALAGVGRRSVLHLWEIGFTYLMIER